MAGTLNDPQSFAALLRRMLLLDIDSRRRWGRMSVHQAVCHLSDAVRMALGDAPPPPRIDTWVTRSVVRVIALHGPFDWPHSVPTIRGFDQVGGEGTAPAEFESDRAELIRLHERLATRAAEAPAAIHPFFGPLTPAEWMIWAYRHADHHLRQFSV